LILNQQNLKAKNYFGIVSNFVMYSKHGIFFWIINTKKNEIRKLLDKTGFYSSSPALIKPSKQPISGRVSRF